VTASTTRRRLEPDARRHQILTCAVRLFGERPYAEVSTTDLAREAGVARGLINHYFGTKKDLYLEVVRVLVTIPDEAVAQIPSGTRAQRVDATVTWFLDVVSHLGRAWLAAVNAEGLGRDPDVVRILAEADEVTAGHVIAVLGLTDDEHTRAMIRAHTGLAKAAAQEWLVRRALTREQVHALLSRTLLTIAEDVAPAASAGSGESGGVSPRRSS
jgi:AcrR family transcriptional regulator